jgi:hypothetical protein
VQSLKGTLGGVAAVAAVLGGHSETAFILMWLCFWLFGEAVAVCALLWNIFGHERVSVGAGCLTHKREMFGRTLSRQSVPTGEISGLRAEGPFGSSTLSREQLGVTGGAIEVEHGWDTFSIGYELERWEAAAVVETLRRHLPETPNNGMQRTRA